MREALEASCSDVCACPFHDAAALLARLRRATELSHDDAARAERADAAADAAADENLRAALHASAASASSDDAHGADMLLAMSRSRRSALLDAAKARSLSDDEAIDLCIALSNSERDGAGVRDTDRRAGRAHARLLPFLLAGVLSTALLASASLRQKSTRGFQIL